jgi:hypothetical protein
LNTVLRNVVVYDMFQFLLQRQSFTLCLRQRFNLDRRYGFGVNSPYLETHWLVRFPNAIHGFDFTSRPHPNNRQPKRAAWFSLAHVGYRGPWRGNESAERAMNDHETVKLLEPASVPGRGRFRTGEDPALFRPREWLGSSSR